MRARELVDEVYELSSKSPWEIFSEECGGVAESYQQLMHEANFGGVLDEKTRVLVLIGIFSATRDAVALRHFVEHALSVGASRREVEAAALLPFATGVSSAELSIPIIHEVCELKGRK